MNSIAIAGLLIPFLGTALGSLCVFLFGKGCYDKFKKPILDFTAGIMTAASFWSLLVPAIEKSCALGRLAFLPASIGFAIGMLALALTDRFVPEDIIASGGNISSKTALMCLAVVLHNIPEGMAVGVVFAGLLADSSEFSVSGALALSIGIAIQNFPEGAIISMPLAASGDKKPVACIKGILSGAVEPVAGIITLLLSGIISALLPCLLGFAAGAMMFVVTKELLPDTYSDNCSVSGVSAYTGGFLLMMILDVAFG